MLVLGHSDSDGSRLANAADSWPRLVVSGMPEAAGLSIELTHRILYPGGRVGRLPKVAFVLPPLDRAGSRGG